MFILIDFETTGLDSYAEPIELGAVALTVELEEIASFQTLIKPTLNQGTQWETESELAAYEIHQISLSEIQANGLTPLHAWWKFSDFVQQASQQYRPPSRYKLPSRPILMSDNAIFDYYFLVKLAGNPLLVRELFHYAVWDVNLFLFTHGKHNVPAEHRALADVKLNLEALREVWPFQASS